MTGGQFRDKDNVIVNQTDHEQILNSAKQTAISLLGKSVPDSFTLFYETDLKKIEQGLKALNEFSARCWLASAITLYTLIYDKELFTQSGLSWEEYLHDSRNRLGMEERDVCEQLSSARFFIKYHKQLKDAGWNPIGSGRKLARAELAYELCGNIDTVITHICNDSWREYKSWYQSFKTPKKIAGQKGQNVDILKNADYKDGVFSVNGVVAFTLSSEISDEDRTKLDGYLTKIKESLQAGYEPAIVPVYDKNEAKVLVRLRDNNRQKK